MSSRWRLNGKNGNKNKVSFSLIFFPLVKWEEEDRKEKVLGSEELKYSTLYNNSSTSQNKNALYSDKETSQNKNALDSNKETFQTF